MLFTPVIAENWLFYYKLLPGTIDELIFCAKRVEFGYVVPDKELECGRPPCGALFPPVLALSEYMLVLIIG